MIQIETNEMLVKINEAGAELTSVFHKRFELEYMWKGDPQFWAKHSPVLFPVVGALKENKYYYHFESYNLPRHGFARERTFQLLNQEADKATFVLKSDEKSLAIYPFHFEFLVNYEVRDSSLNVSYEIINTGNEEMYFSLGAHPAFAVPLTNDTHYEDYFLLFEKPENANRWPISADGLIEPESKGFLSGTKKLALRKDLFYEDALVFKDLKSEKISIKSDFHEHGLDFFFEGFPYFGIWAAKNAPFVCLEPWCGIADSVNADQQLVHKEGINRLAPTKSFKRNWSISIY